MKVVILGAGGQLGTDLQLVMGDWDTTPLRRQDTDICDYRAVREALNGIEPDVVVNAAGYVRVDDAESHVEEAFGINAFAVRNLAQVCSERDCVLMHVSTDYVFDGAKGSPYTEDDCPNPLGAYGASKLAGESFVRSLCPRHFIVRSSGLYGLAGSSGKGGNFVETMLRLAREGRPIRVVDDQVLTPTYTKDLAAKMKELLKSAPFGLYHATNAGQCSWYEFAARVFEEGSVRPTLQAISSLELGAQARRPEYSVLISRSMPGLGLVGMQPWGDALSEYFRSKE